MVEVCISDSDVVVCLQCIVYLVGVQIRRSFTVPAAQNGKSVLDGEEAAHVI